MRLTHECQTALDIHSIFREPCLEWESYFYETRQLLEYFVESAIKRLSSQQTGSVCSSTRAVLALPKRACVSWAAAAILSACTVHCDVMSYSTGQWWASHTQSLSCPPNQSSTSQGNIAKQRTPVGQSWERQGEDFSPGPSVLWRPVSTPRSAHCASKRKTWHPKKCLVFFFIFHQTNINMSRYTQHVHVSGLESRFPHQGTKLGTTFIHQQWNTARPHDRKSKPEVESSASFGGCSVQLLIS